MEKEEEEEDDEEDEEDEDEDDEDEDDDEEEEEEEETRNKKKKTFNTTENWRMYCMHPTLPSLLCWRDKNIFSNIFASLYVCGHARKRERICVDTQMFRMPFVNTLLLYHIHLCI